MSLSSLTLRIFRLTSHTIIACALISLLAISPSSFGQKPQSSEYLEDLKTGTHISYNASWTSDSTLTKRFTRSERFLSELNKDNGFIQITIASFSQPRNTFREILDNTCLQHNFDCTTTIEDIEIFNQKALSSKDATSQLIFIPLKLHNQALVLYSNQPDLTNHIHSIHTEVPSPEYIVYREDGLKISYPRALKKFDRAGQSANNDITPVLTLLQNKTAQQLQLISIHRVSNPDNLNITDIIDSKTAGYDDYCGLLELGCNSSNLKFETLDTQLKPAVAIGGWQDVMTGLPMVQIYIPASNGQDYLFIEANSTFPELRHVVNNIQFVQ